MDLSRSQWTSVDLIKKRYRGKPELKDRSKDLFYSFPGHSQWRFGRTGEAVWRYVKIHFTIEHVGLINRQSFVLFVYMSMWSINMMDFWLSSRDRGFVRVCFHDNWLHVIIMLWTSESVCQSLCACFQRMCWLICFNNLRL